MAKNLIIPDEESFGPSDGLYDVKPVDEPWFLAADDPHTLDDIPLPR